jgi:hypothetical protein
MALDGTYIGLKASLADWLNRSDLTAQIPDFIILAEAEMKRRLRRTSVRNSAFSITAQAVAAPGDCAELRSIYLISTQMMQDVPIRLCTPEMLAERRARNAGAVGRPSDVAVMAGYFNFAPAPDQTYTAEIFYFQSLIPLNVGTPTTTLYTEAPDMYLYGALLQAAPFLENDERIPTWQGKFDNSIEQMNYVREREEYTASLRAVRLPVVF